MRFPIAAVLAAVVGTASAHFQLQYPPPRGVFNMNNEPTFCDGYDTSIDNRTVFPLSGGTVSLNSEHVKWTFGAILSTLSNPQNFGNFSQAIPFFQVNGEGAFCFPVDLSAANIPGVQDGTNVTLQFVFDGGDGELFQCADVTLSSSATVPSSVSCTNATGDSVQSASAVSFSATLSTSASSTSANAPAQTSSSAASATNIVGATGFLALIGALLSAL